VNPTLMKRGMRLIIEQTGYCNKRFKEW
jgi:hypothetical protein